MSARLNDKVAVITGGASGVGEATVRRFVAEGARVVFTDLNVQAGEQLAEELSGKALFMAQDVSQPEGWEQLAELIKARFQRLDVLVNNAGILLKGSVEDASLADWQRLMRVNAESVFLGCQTALALMKIGAGGSIINMSSVAAIAAKHDYLAYSASKGAVAALTRSVAAHCRLNKYRIRCNSVHPDGILTAMTRATYPQGVDPARLTIDHDPMNRSCLPSDVADAILYLASDEARAVNGIELRVDSGQFVMSI
ncbi:glucose 1-dehydrogenase [Pseudomonas sp. R5(2019)]|uniref:glucose 1-dehydrogenase n=1 Tax=Pseudomonas sp. R5(2019) TaxID=2697566 RepID=UPI001411CCA3|nr:glucose 1-dehydrogenase [Pseudomonas sp. R5(2019)]NBA97306.1 glucose 1-dehydrogenase [Pseudomonas sp. R5(2019)]